MNDEHVQVIRTFFGPMAVIRTDIRIAQEIKQLGHWEAGDFLEIMRVFDRYYSGTLGAFLDIGCNIGTWTLPLAHRYPNPIFAFDCQSLACRALQQTIQLNRLHSVRVQQCAISDQVGHLPMPAIDYSYGANFGSFELVAPYKNPDSNVQHTLQHDKIATMTVDALDIGPIAFIKLDVEGMELASLLGAQRTLEKDRPFIVFEHHKTDRTRAEDLLTNLGYREYNTIGQMSMFIPRDKDSN
jgi:FkbM family methyltransferase